MTDCANKQSGGRATETGAKAGYPAEWWKEIPLEEKESWEILPQEAGPGEVILSKRTELGVFSNFAHTPITLDGQEFASIEGLWQSLKYPEPDDPTDPRHKVAWPHTRAQVMALFGFDAKHAGDEASKIMSQLHINWVSYQQHRMMYKDGATGSKEHYDLIRRATVEKLNAHPDVRALLIRTKGLVLRPDHEVDPKSPPAYFYYKIYMELRDEL
jgi:predicted NAD-dependent protein-ADP-ribosyltransferase YbiA (DUF1768 family)